jgi:PTH1 family peptidyl-tRNA hydrolase
MRGFFLGDTSTIGRPHGNAIMTIKLLVGLGNPGPEYDDTRHNAGFWWVDGAARRLGATLRDERSHHGRMARVNRPDGPLWLLEPMTFMNLSGKAVASLARFYKIAPDEILVVHDELDLLPGQAKLKRGGGAAGHNGLKDIQAQLGSPDFWRLRLGIGHPGVRSEVVGWVLRKPPATERDAIEQCITRTLDSLDLLIAGQMERAMMALHFRAAPSPAPAAPPGPTPAASPPPNDSRP